MTVRIEGAHILHLAAIAVALERHMGKGERNDRVGFGRWRANGYPHLTPVTNSS